MEFDNEDFLMHYGVKYRSGRYPYGSGENPYQHDPSFLARVNALRKEGFIYVDDNGKEYTGDTAVAKYLGLTTSQFRNQVSLANAEVRAPLVAKAKELRDQGMSLDQIAKEMGYSNDSSIRSLLNEKTEVRMNESQKLALFLEDQIKEKGMIDVGSGVARQLGFSETQMSNALAILAEKGYPTYGGGLPQVTNPGKQTNLKVVCPPGYQNKDIYRYDEIHSVEDYTSKDGGETFQTFRYPASMDSSRLAIRYGDQGGSDMDGVIEVRRGVKDLDMGDSHYAQVRILVDGTHYLKGMAVYSDNLPKGVDVRFNTNKKTGTPMEKVLKPIKDDPTNPFGALIMPQGQSDYYDENGEKHLSLINKTRAEGEWKEWTNTLPSQFLAKQPLKLIKNQLDISKADKQEEFDEIMSLTNPTIKKKLLQDFADDCDANSVHLKAASLPRQTYQVILPMPTMKDNEVFAPNFNNGETVALIRYPHGGTFEIPILKVNNKQEDAIKAYGTNAKDAVAINSNVAARLSGADFDGDTVMVIPCNSANSRVSIMSTKSLEGLKGFDPKDAYPEVKGMRYMKYVNDKGKTIDNTQKEMGTISNLIMDMTLKGADEDELSRAVRHSMVIIDAGKHKLDYKQSEIDNDIAQLKRKYQGHTDEEGNYHEGASTLITRAKSDYSVVKRQGSARINQKGKPWYDETRPEGAKIWKESDKARYVDRKTGKEVVRTQKSTRMEETNDATTLISEKDTPQERYYADYANFLKSTANKARLEMIATPRLEYSPSANKVYQGEAQSLKAKLNESLKNAPRERMAQIMANTVVDAKKESNPDMTNKEKKKVGQMALTDARIRLGAQRTLVEINDKEWEAIQAGAISDNLLQQILDHTDVDKLRERALPRQKETLNAAKINLIKSMETAGYSNAEIANRLNVSTSTISKYLT